VVSDDPRRDRQAEEKEKGKRKKEKGKRKEG
jgi:hypothetical protein